MRAHCLGGGWRCSSRSNLICARNDFREFCINTVFNYVFSHLTKEELKFFSYGDIHVEVISSILQNNKAASGSDNQLYIITSDDNKPKSELRFAANLKKFFMKGEK